jgi:microsomal prostaglandin-E synthase 2
MRGVMRTSVPLALGSTLLMKRSVCEHSKSNTDHRAHISDIDILMFQYKICPFCNLVKANLDYLGLPYRVVEVNPLTQSEIKFTDEPRKVPIVILNGEITKESAVVVKKLKDILIANGGDRKILNALYPSDTDKWMDWSREQLAVKIYPNITRNFSESWQAFEYANHIDSWTWYERYSNRVAGPIAMFFANGKIKAKHNIKDERAELLGTIHEWTLALGTKKYLHGDEITTPDLCVYGVLRSITGFDTFSILMQDDILKQWYDRVNTEVEKRKYSKA